MDTQTLKSTDFSLPGQTGLYHGKVRDVYTIDDDLLISVATDRISAFDVILPRAIPYKGQVLNQLAAHFLQATSDIVPNWLEAVPDPNVSAGVKAEPFRVEMIVRSMLVGHAWREYQAGKRQICGIALPDGLNEYDTFKEPIITPTTKADEGHDEDISAPDIIANGLATKEEWEQLEALTMRLFNQGQVMAHERGLILADTKYEFGKLPDGTIILIDEVHTPDSSRYYYADGFGQGKPKDLSKEFVREWLMSQGFDGNGQPLPEMTDDFVNTVSERYIELYEKMTGQAFDRVKSDNILERIKNNLTDYLEKRNATN